MQEAEPEVSSKAVSARVVDCLVAAALGVPSSLLFLADRLSAYELAAVLVCGGLFSILILRRVFKLDRALDDPERIAAGQSLIEQEAERRKTKR